MKIPIIRATGMPVELSDLENYRNEFRRLCDIAARGAKNDMLRLQKRLATVEKVLTKIYPTLAEVDFCDTPDAWKALMDKYGNILVSSHRHTGDLVFVIDDREEVRY